MDIIVGIIFWGGLLVLVLGWLTRSADPGPGAGPGASASDRTFTARSSAPPSRSGSAVPTDEARLRETEALTDGLVIGHFLTRDHYRRRIDALEGELDAAGSAPDRFELTGDDTDFDAGFVTDFVTDFDTDFDTGPGLGADPDADLDVAEFDAMGGFGVEPWADDLFGDFDDFDDG